MIDFDVPGTFCALRRAGEEKPLISEVFVTAFPLNRPRLKGEDMQQFKV
ncbi:hypothetical protein [Sinorhizobium saheli]|nr:hypothetical protein [Sinorhizobium saheli]MQW90144.1 hypothetical protein [Sinorhizobium saheli]